jgi:hypothetical protein
MIASVTPVMTYVSDEQYPFSGGHFEERAGETALSSSLEFIIPYFIFPYIAVTIFSVDIRAIQKISRNGLDSACIVYFIHNIF